jgi:SAM-dependent methyltransferase
VKNTFNNWDDLRGKNINEVLHLIVTNQTLENVLPDLHIINEIGMVDRQIKLLDFGCGIGRNVFEFSKNKNWHIVGYDNDFMLEMSKEYCKLKYNKNLNNFSNITLSSEWEFIKKNKFDCVYATLVFQHIFEKDLNTYLQDIKQISTKMVVMGRRYNDDIDVSSRQFKNTWKILENNGFYPCDAKHKGYTTDGDIYHHLTVCYKWDV